MERDILVDVQHPFIVHLHYGRFCVVFFSKALVFGYILMKSTLD